MHDVANHLDDVLRGQRPLLKREIEAQLLVQLEPAYRREIVAFGIEEEVLKQRTRGLDGGRFPWAQPLVDLDHGLFLGGVLVTLERVFDQRRRRGAVVEDDLERVDLAGQDLLQDLSRQLVILFKDLLFGGDGHQVDQDGAAHQVLGVDLDLFDPRCLQPADGGLGELRAFAGDELLAPLLHQVIGDAQAGMDLRVQLPPQLALLDVDLLHGVVHPEEIIGGVPEGFQQDRRRHLPPSVDPDVEDDPPVKLKVEPRSAIRDDPRREQDLAAGVGTALVMREERPRRSVQLAHHHPLGPVDDERAALRHQRQFADVDLLLAYVQDFLGRRFVFLVEHHETHADLQGRGVAHPLLHALAHIVLRRPQAVVDELQHRRAVVVRDGEHAGERGLQPLVLASVRIDLHLQEAVIGPLLDFDEIRNVEVTRDLRKVFPFDQTAARHFGHGSSPTRIVAVSPDVPGTAGGISKPTGTRYLISTLAPCSSSFFLTFSASSLVTPVLTGLGAPSTRSFASSRPRLVSSRTTLMTWIFLSAGADTSTTSNAVFSSAAAAAPLPVAGAATATGAAAVTPKRASNPFTSSAKSSTLIVSIALINSSCDNFAVVVDMSPSPFRLS